MATIGYLTLWTPSHTHGIIGERPSHRHRKRSLSRIRIRSVIDEGLVAIGHLPKGDLYQAVVSEGIQPLSPLVGSPRTMLVL